MLAQFTHKIHEHGLQNILLGALQFLENEIVHTCSIAVYYSQFWVIDAYILFFKCNFFNQRKTNCILLWSFVGLVVYNPIK